MSIPRLVRILGRNGRDVLVAALVIVSLMLSSFSPAFAAGGVNGNVTGTVVDATGHTLSGARITFAAPTGSFKAVTDSRGNFAILNLTADTYTVSVEPADTSLEPLKLTGVTVNGDQNLNLGQLKVQKALQVIGTGRATGGSSSVYKPNQTTDTVTLGASRIAQSLGNVKSTDERSLVQAAPGVSLTDTNAITIRGGLTTEVGYNFDGIPYNEPFLSQNGSANRFSGASNVQIVEGAGDASQGNIAGGAVNINIKRGTYPGVGLLDAEVGGPNGFQQGSFEYGLATRDNRFSDYFSYTQSNQVDYFGSKGLDPTAYGNAFATARTINQDLINNFVFKFGHNNNQSLQVLYENRDLRGYGYAGGVFGPGSTNPTQYFQTDPRIVTVLGLKNYVGGTDTLNGFASSATANLNSILPLLPGQAGVGTRPPGDPETVFNPTQVLKFEYDGTFGDNSISLRAYNSNFGTGNNAYTSANSTTPFQQITGGRRAGLIADLTHQFGQRYTLSLNFTGESQKPQFDVLDPTVLVRDLRNYPNGIKDSGAIAPAKNVGAAPSLSDFLSPVNGICPVDGGCYLSNYFAPGQIPKVPIPGISYGQSQFKTFGFGLRNQYQFGENVKADLGLRYEGAIYDFGTNQYNTSPSANRNPTDVPASFLNNAFTNPRVVEPRVAVAYEINRDNSIRFGYGRSAIFLNAQTAGTPAFLYNGEQLKGVPATDSIAHPACGSATNVTAGNPSGLFKCANYAAQLFWFYDQNHDAPDIGSDTLQTANNYDVTYQHQFKGGYGLRVTPFYKSSSGVPSFAIKSVVTDPNTGAILNEVFTANNLGIDKTTGVELGFSTPDRLYGLTGFASATYQNVLDSAPPLIGGEDTLPTIGSGSLVLNDIYRAGYVSPVVLRVGGDYHFKNGFRVAPVISYDIGYPYSLGNTTASTNPINGAFANVPQTNNSNAITTAQGFTNAVGAQLATQYVDPANPGNTLNPNIAATRGTPQTSSAGGKLSPANFRADLTLEYKSGRNTFGIQGQNLFGTQFQGVIPQVNPYFQPVSTGVAGPQTGQLKQANPAFANGIYVDRGYANVPTNAYAFNNGAFLIAPNVPTRFTFYYQLGL